MRVTKIEDLHNLSVNDSKRLPSAHLLARWSTLGLYRIDAKAGRFVVAGHNKPRIQAGRHAGRVDLNAARIA